MRYIFLNPVVQSLYDAERLRAFLEACGYRQIGCDVDWVSVVRQKYRQALRDADGIVVDMRCPEAVRRLKEANRPDSLVFPDIEPILIHCAYELAQDERYRLDEITVITPCTFLVGYGEKLGYTGVSFMTWTAFTALQKKRGILPPILKNLEESPIPPGFFQPICPHVFLLTGESCFSRRIDFPRGTELVEMLFCPDGCHHGNGVLP